MNKFSAAIKFGSIWGVASIIFNLSIYIFTGKIESHPVVSFLIFAAGIAVMYFIGVARRTEAGGYIEWKEAMTHIWVGAMISSVLTIIFTFIMYNYIAPELIDQIKELQIEMLEKFRSTIGDAKTDAEIEKLESSNPFSLLNTLLMIGGSILIQFLVSCLVALAVKKKNPNEFFNTPTDRVDPF